MRDGFEQARDLFLEGVRAFERGAWAEAEQRFEASLALLPDRPSTLMNLGAARIRLGRPGDALAPLERALAQDPGSVEAWCHHGAALAALGRPQDAVRAFDRALALAPALVAARFQRARQLQHLGAHAEAADEFERVLAERPQDAEAWFLRGQALQACDRPAAALDCYDRVLALDAASAAAWSQRGGLLKDLGRLDEAAECFRRAIACGGDAELNGYLLASIEGGAAPGAAPRAYVEGLFDGYAGSFDEHLVGRLGYRTPQLLAALLPPDRRFDAALDLGCGTGLMAPLLAPRCAAIDGVDLSSQMLARARAGGLYRALHHADVVEQLRCCEERYGLVVAADVFVYVGALDAVFAGVARVLDPGGLFLFSVEEADAGQALQLRSSARYAHSEPLLRSLAATAGFVVQRLERATLRRDQHAAIGGLLCCLQRDAGSPAPRREEG